MTDRTKTSRPQKSKWYRKPLKLDGINFNKNHFLVGFQWPYTNCMGTTYLTTMTAGVGHVNAWDLHRTGAVSILNKYMKG